MSDFYARPVESGGRSPNASQTGTRNTSTADRYNAASPNYGSNPAYGGGLDDYSSPERSPAPAKAPTAASEGYYYPTAYPTMQPAPTMMAPPATTVVSAGPPPVQPLPGSVTHPNRGVQIGFMVFGGIMFLVGIIMIIYVEANAVACVLNTYVSYYSNYRSGGLECVTIMIAGAVLAGIGSIILLASGIAYWVARNRAIQTQNMHMLASGGGTSAIVVSTSGTGTMGPMVASPPMMMAPPPAAFYGQPPYGQQSYGQQPYAQQTYGQQPSGAYPGTAGR